FFLLVSLLFLFSLLRIPSLSILFPTRRSSDLPHHLLLVTLQRRCYPILFVAHLSLWYRSVRYLFSLLQFVSRFLMFGLTHLLRLFHLVLLIRLMLLLPISYQLRFSLVLHSLLLDLLLIIDLCPRLHYY